MKKLSLNRFKTFSLLIIGVAMTTTSCTNSQPQESPITKTVLEVNDGVFTPEMLNTLGRVSDPQVSPDGKKILFGVSYPSIEQNKSNRELFVMDIDGNNRVHLTSTAKGENNARWYQDGKKILFLRSGQLWVMNSDGSGEKQLSSVENGIMEFKLSPDQKRLIYTSEFKSATKPVDIYPDLEKSTGRIITDLMYRHWDHFVENIPHSYIADLGENGLGEGVDILDGAPFELPAEPFSGIEQLAWSPDGTKIAYSCRKLTGKEYAFSTNSDIYLYDIATAECKNLTEGMMGYDTEPSFSPDGSKLAFLSMERDGYEADKVRLFIINLEDESKVELTENKFKYNVEGPVWMEDSKGLYFSSLVEGLKGIWRVDLDGNFAQVTPEREWYDFSSPTIVGDRLIATNTSMMRPSEIVSISATDGSWSAISHENDELISKLDEPKVEERWIKTTDGKKMLTWVLYPPKFDESKKYPSILVCLGGPQGTLSQGWSYRWNYRLMAQQGYIVILPNRRGTTAFGQEWCEQISGDYCGQNIKDYLSAADALKAEPYVGKMAAVGASYGGYSVYYLAGVHQNRFDAFIAHAGIFNQEHMYMVTEEMWFPNWDNGGIAQPNVKQSGAPWSDNPVAKRHYANSPHKLIKNWDTPILVIHGELDYRVPVDQGMAAFNAAQMMGVPSEMLLFPDENHWILKPQNSIHWHRTFFGWLDKWCK